tara:strand:+ start:147 stop:1181 length:1035 start_codon:yes stop_codon:yes gene_type:complete
MKIIDLRSDTITLPSDRMIDAISTAKLGDDVLSEDPTVNFLENKASQITGKEAAILVPSGTMGNLIAFLVHCDRGTEAILGDRSHTFLYEAGGISAFGGIHSRQLMNMEDGTIDLDKIELAIRTNDIHFPRTSLISIENTHNMCNGTPLSLAYLSSIKSLSRKYNIPIHMDGARLFNASVATKEKVANIVTNVSSVTFCLSKGLASPVGSILCGNKKFIYKARRVRKALGGGMRQAGIIAASGIVSLDTMIEQISYDHDNAQYLANELSEISCVDLDKEKVSTNIIYFNILGSKLSDNEIINTFADEGIMFFDVSKNRFRLVTHYGITREDISYTIEKFKKILG